MKAAPYLVHIASGALPRKKVFVQTTLNDFLKNMFLDLSLDYPHLVIDKIHFVKSQKFVLYLGFDEETEKLLYDDPIAFSTFFSDDLFKSLEGLKAIFRKKMGIRKVAFLIPLKKYLLQLQRRSKTLTGIFPFLSYGLEQYTYLRKALQIQLRHHKIEMNDRGFLLKVAPKVFEMEEDRRNFFHFLSFLYDLKEGEVEEYFPIQFVQDDQFSLEKIEKDNSLYLLDMRKKALERIQEQREKESLLSLAKQEVMEGQKQENHTTPDIAPFSSTTQKSKPYETKVRKWMKKTQGHLWGKFQEGLDTTELTNIHAETGFVQVRGKIEEFTSMWIANGSRCLFKFLLVDKKAGLSCKIFLKPEEVKGLEAALSKKEVWVLLQAEVAYDATYTKDLDANVKGLALIDKPKGREEQAREKRVELHCHSQMSAQDAIPPAAKIVELAHQFGHEAVAITDHGVVQAFPEAYNTAKALKKNTGRGIKLILGMEGYMIDDGPTIVYGNRPFSSDLKNFVAVDVETTGLNPSIDRIIEIGATRFVRQEKGNYIAEESFQCFVNPHVRLSSKIQELTQITNEMIEQEGLEPREAIEKLADFVKDSVLCAHNALFDLGFLRYEGFRVPGESDVKIKFNQPIVDTVELARYVWNEGQRKGKLNNLRLNTVCEYLNIPLASHHRANHDAKACGEIFAQALRLYPDYNLDDFNRKLAGQLPEEEIRLRQNKPNHIIFLAKDQLGLYALYRLVSASHVKYYNFRPRLPKSLIAYYRAGLIIGGACVDGDVFKSLIQCYQAANHQEDLCLESFQPYLSYKQKQTLGENLAKIGYQTLEKARFYDYLEIQPLTNNQFLVREHIAGLSKFEQLKSLNRLMLALGKAAKKPVCATCDAHFLHPEDKIYRSIVQASMGFKDLSTSPDLYFRTTDEMLAEFSSYLPDELVREVVLKNPKWVADQVQEGLKPFPDGSFPPRIETAAEEVRNLTMSKALEWYGYQGELPELVQQRIEKELQSIICNGFAVMYYIAHKLVKKSNDDGYIVGSRGSVGSSLVATLCGITEVNPLQAHYRCPQCKFSEFKNSGEYGSGFDLEEKACPHCGSMFIRDGQDIPFETFLGFNGDKQPDIDLNFSGEYQARAHAYIEEMFGKSYTFRAGTIGAYAEKNALALVDKYSLDEQVNLNPSSKRVLAQGLVGIKKTTGQHPGGIVVIPKERDIYEFTPIQYPANKLDSPMTTTHFDFTMMHDTILKLDVLGHDDPTMLRFLSVMTGIDVRTIPIPDPTVMKLFVSTDVLGIPMEESKSQSATLGLPEMGTFMAREMIKETKPTMFYDLVQLMGLSHGTDVWKGNAQDLIRSGTCSINTVIGCRDSIMTFLIYQGLPSKAAFDIMEKVRKGKGLSSEDEALMRENKVPEWYIDSCKKIKYMFPKAHAVAYLISALRIAWFKVYYPEAYYAAFFSVRADEFDASVLCQGSEHLQAQKQSLRESFYGNKAKDKDKKLYYICELAEEMEQRNIFFAPITLMDSEAEMFQVIGKGSIRPSLNTVPGISSAMGHTIVEARKQGPFKSQLDLMSRCNFGQSVIQSLQVAGLLKELPEDDQIDLFSML